jgi:hypothetical protein
VFLISHVYIVAIEMSMAVENLESTEKIQDLMMLLTMNGDHLRYELTSFSTKVNNFLDDIEMMLSGQLLSVMYAALTEQNENEMAGIGANDVLVSP